MFRLVSYIFLGWGRSLGDGFFFIFFHLLFDPSLLHIGVSRFFHSVAPCNAGSFPSWHLLAFCGFLFVDLWNSQAWAVAVPCSLFYDILYSYQHIAAKFCIYVSLVCLNLLLVPYCLITSACQVGICTLYSLPSSFLSGASAFVFVFVVVGFFMIIFQVFIYYFFFGNHYLDELHTYIMISSWFGYDTSGFGPRVSTAWEILVSAESNLRKTYKK